ncbi:MAG: DUF996 domain-containing protein [Conexivisphaerales archaeon]|jgi:uncharacterized membrane protein
MTTARQAGLYGEIAFVPLMFILIFQVIGALLAPSGFYWGRESQLVIWFDLPGAGRLNLLVFPLIALALVTLVFLYLAFRRLSEAASENGIWSNAVWAIAFLFLAGVLTPLQLFHANTNVVNGVLVAYGPTFDPFLFTVGLIETWALPVVAAVFIWRSFSLVTSKLNVRWFRLAGTLQLVAAVAPIEALGYATLAPYPLFFYAVWVLLSFVVVVLLLVGFNEVRNLKV